MTRFPPRWCENTPDLICLGLSALDYVWTVETFADPGGGKVRASDFRTIGGGMAATAAVTAARLGARVQFWGRAGDDTHGHLMRRDLEERKVDVSNFRLFPGARSSISGVIVDARGERQIVNFRGANQPTDPGWLPLTEIGEAGAVLADPRWPEGAAAVFAAAREKGVPTVLDADVADPEVFDLLLPLTDHAVFSKRALEVYARNAPDPLAKIEAYGCRIAAVTEGSKGVTWREHGQTCHQPAFPVRSVDTTGAGDVFHGAYAFGLAAGAPIAEAFTFASAAAALKCTKPGGRDGIPTLDETLHLWRTAHEHDR
ncbi:PfkB family carbohydrate kinase [Chelativorans sp. SCAU2101]|uniref:PfkB family carbohydrate kinase n=1 Tax=Chelativorans petroleitrophicus TaxID=2975484 RepID=A0A9X2X977_9HYPH|nr:PfkB family carbohydrate kinase [Chelativorans petroleitrophicus]MCT8990404.1 PfkB family carbohydrate kinase [Chelativorans petroleitrophicus]